MNKILWTTLLGGFLSQAVLSTASAGPMTATFDGTVTGAGFFSTVLDSFPVGTHVAFNVNYDEHFGDNTNPTRFYTESTTGWLDIGSSHYVFDRDEQGWFHWNYIDGYESSLAFYGTGPATPDGGQLFGLFLSFWLSDGRPSSAPTIGFQYNSPGGGASFSYAETAGTFATAPTPVPEPGTLALSALGLIAVVAGVRRKRVAHAWAGVG